MEEMQRVSFEVANLKMAKENLQPDLVKVSEEEELQMRSLERVHEELEHMRKKMEKSLMDLTHGLHMYAALGLEFQKAEGDCMRLIFTQIDRANPLKEFSFLIFVDDQEKYQLVRTTPQLDKNHCTKLLDQFNKDNDIGRFVLQMRNSFKRLCMY
jgi:hypothetical protein